MKTVKRDKIPFEIRPKTICIALHIRYLVDIKVCFVSKCRHSMILSLTEDGNYDIRDSASICSEDVFHLHNLPFAIL